MLLLTVLLLLQGQAGILDSQTFRISGKVTADNAPVMVDIVVKDTLGAVVQTTRSFANGTFNFNGIKLGIYSIAVTDARYNLFDYPLLLREAADTGKNLVINLTPRGMTEAATNSADAPAVDMDAVSKTVQPEAFDEFKKGIEAVRSRTKGNPPDAHFKKAIEIAPDFYEAYIQLGLEDRRQNLRPDAVAAFEHAAAIKPAMPQPFRLLGAMYVEDQQFQKAIDSLFKVGQLGTLDADDRMNMGTAFFKLNNLGAAEQQLLTSIKLAPNKAGVYLQLHNVYMKANNLVSGLRVLEDYIKMFPSDPNLKAINERAKKIREALKKP